MKVQRIQKELLALRESPPPFVELVNEPTSLSEWHVRVYSPAGSPYEGKDMVLSVKFGTEYPFKPPYIKFVTPMFHPNVGVSGHICVNFLGHDWSPGQRMNAVFTSIVQLIQDPNVASPLNGEAAIAFSVNKEHYARAVDAHMR